MAEPIRDFKYYKTLMQDLLWHQIRRWRHQLGVQQEKKVAWLQTPAPRNGQRLSVCIITMNAADRITPLIAHCKTFADEIVIGVDSKTTDNTFDVCQQAGADTVFWIQNDAQTCNAGLEALVDHCTGDWILRLDDDEYMEPEFLPLIGNFMHQPHFTHFKFPRLHLCQVHPLLWINDSYLYPDYQMRLFKNDKRLLHFPGAVGHTSITSDGPKGRVFGINIIHLNLAINSLEKRQAKLNRYIERHHGGWVHPINEYALLYERFNYRIEPYRHPDAGFCKLLTHVVDTVQRQATNEHPKAPSSKDNNPAITAVK